MDYYLNTYEPKPEHGEEGKYRQFNGSWEEGLTYTVDRFGRDIYCSGCNHWSTVKGKNILYSVLGNCKNCGKSFIKL